MTYLWACTWVHIFLTLLGPRFQNCPRYYKRVHKSQSISLIMLKIMLKVWFYPLLKTRPAHANVHFDEISLKTSYHNRVATESLTLISFPKGGDILNHLRKTKKAAASDGGAEQLSKQILHNKPSFLLDRMNTVKMHKWKKCIYYRSALLNKR